MPWLRLLTHVVNQLLGVGAGNVPAYVEKSANIRQAAHDIVMSKSFDNGMVCASEQAVIMIKKFTMNL